MTAAGIFARGPWGGGPAYVGLHSPMPPPIVVRAVIAFPSGDAAFSHVDDIAYPFRIGESVYVGNVEYLVQNFVEDRIPKRHEDRIVVSTINKMDVWVYKEVKQEDVWLPVDAMAPANG